MSYTRVAPAGLIPVGLQKMTLANSTAIAVNSTIRTARILYISVKTEAARMRDDGTDPALETGLRLPANLLPFVHDGYNGTSVLKFQRTTGTSVVTVLGYKRVGD